MVHLLFMRDFAFMDKREVKSFDVMSVPENGNWLDLGSLTQIL